MTFKIFQKEISLENMCSLNWIFGRPKDDLKIYQKAHK